MWSTCRIYLWLVPSRKWYVYWWSAAFYAKCVNALRCRNRSPKSVALANRVSPLRKKFFRAVSFLHVRSVVLKIGTAGSVSLQ